MRPYLHYAPAFGWLNDPNGLLYDQGVFHIFHQHNPYGLEWENIHWSYTSTKDFIHWSYTEPALRPDCEGPIYSGTGLLDKYDLLGYGKHAYLYFYTSAGGRSEWSKNGKFTQRIAYSRDENKSISKSDCFCMPHVCDENRDPKVFYHEESQAYIMVLYMTGFCFCFYRSEDLLNWVKTQELEEKGMCECPDLFPLVDERTGDKKWVFWAADGYYLIGDFDGYTFQPTSERKEAYAVCKREYVRAYAAQTVHNSNGRVVQISWLTSQKENRSYTGLLSLPVQLSLLSIGKEQYVTLLPTEEVKAMRKKADQYNIEQEFQLPYEVQKEPMELEIHLQYQSKGNVTIEAFGQIVQINFDEKMIEMCDRKSSFAEDSFLQEHGLDFQMFFDQDVIEIYAMSGLKYFVQENKSEDVCGTVRLCGTADTKGTIVIHELEKVVMEENASNNY